MKTSDRMTRWLDRNALRLTALLMLVFVLVLAIVPYSFIAVGSGRTGVIWSRFGGGTVTDKVLVEGTHLVWPWNRVSLYDTRATVDNSDYTALTSDGVRVQVQVSYVYRPIETSLGWLHKLIGPDYRDQMIRPEIGAAVRIAINHFTTKELYSGDREERLSTVLQQTLNDNAIGGVKGHVLGSEPSVDAPTIALVDVERILVRTIILPDLIRKAIDQKIMAQQAIEEAGFKVETERFQATQRHIEAEAIKDFQTVVGDLPAENFLRLRSIEALLKLAQSPGSRLVVIGGRDGTPLILNPDGAGPASTLDRVMPKSEPDTPPRPHAALDPPADPQHSFAVPPALSSAPPLHADVSAR